MVNGAMFFTPNLTGIMKDMCVYDEHPLAGQDIQYRAPDSQSRYTTPFDEILKQCVTC